MKQGQDGIRTTQQDFHQQNAFMTHVPVLVIGGGPTGLLQALLLARLNVRTILVEKYPHRLAAPKAHALSPRSLEICRQFGVSTAELRRLGTPRAEAQWVNFCTNLNSERIGRLPYERMDKEVLEDTPEMIHNIPQPEFEAHIAQLLAEEPLVEVKKGLGFVSCTQDDLGVTSVLEDYQTKRRVKVHSRYIVGCDGAKSAVRKNLNITCDGEDSTDEMMTIHFRADITDVVKDRVGMLHWCLDPAVSGFIIAYDMRGDMVLISNFDPVKRPAKNWTLEHGRQAVLAAIGTDVPVHVLSCRPWILSRKVAQSYRVGKVFLAGDAAHSFPPTGGLGLNCGLADVHNLAWKLALAIHGQVGSSFLDTYDAERRPVAELYSRQSVKNAKSIFSFLKRLGTADIADIEEARANLHATVGNPSKKDLVASLVAGQREHFDNIQLHIGYVYGSKAQMMHASHYVRTFSPGARLPHIWIRNKISQLEPIDLSYVQDLSASEVEARDSSILDLCSPDAFTIFIGYHETDDGFQTIADDLTGIVRWNTRVHGRDYDVSVQSSREWLNACQRVSIVVRPDQHILALIRGPEEAKRAILEYIGHPDITQR